MPDANFHDAARHRIARQTLEFRVFHRRRVLGSQWTEFAYPDGPIKAFADATRAIDKACSMFADAMTNYAWKIMQVHCVEFAVDFPAGTAGDDCGRDAETANPLSNKKGEVRV